MKMIRHSFVKVHIPNDLPFAPSYPKLFGSPSEPSACLFIRLQIRQVGHRGVASGEVDVDNHLSSGLACEISASMPMTRSVPATTTAPPCAPLVHDQHD